MNKSPRYRSKLLPKNRIPDGARPDSLAPSPGGKIDQPRDWRGERLARLRALIRQADPRVVEEMKWAKPSRPAGVPVWSHDGILCTGETYKDKLKLTFARGAALPDPGRLFNASLDAGTRRAIDIHEDTAMDDRAFQALIQAAVAFNTAQSRK